MWTDLDNQLVHTKQIKYMLKVVTETMVQTYIIFHSLIIVFPCRLDYECVVKGYLFRKGRMKVTVSEIHRVSFMPILLACHISIIILEPKTTINNPKRNINNINRATLDPNIPF